MLFTNMSYSATNNANCWGSGKFWDFDSLHQKPRVGGTLGRVRRDGSDGWQSPDPRGDSTGRARPPTPSANHRLLVPQSGSVHRDEPLFLCIVTVASPVF